LCWGPDACCWPGKREGQLQARNCHYTYRHSARTRAPPTSPSPLSKPPSPTPTPTLRTPRSVKTLRLPDGSEERVGCGDHCLNRVMKIHCDPRTCPCGVYCSNKPFHQLESQVGGWVGGRVFERQQLPLQSSWVAAAGLQQPNAAATAMSSHISPLTPTLPTTETLSTPQTPKQSMEIFHTVNNRGHGVRATRPIKRGEFIVEYAGGCGVLHGSAFLRRGAQVPSSELLTVCSLLHSFLKATSPYKPPNPRTQTPNPTPTSTPPLNPNPQPHPSTPTPTPTPPIKPGEVIDAHEMQRRMEAQRVMGQHHFYIMELGPGLFIDALRRGNHARLLNSSCEPNCETQKWWVLV